ncbi:uncharacterized protein ASCRUDRAFT_76589 [Ascoidea rubescens DSM 1968]|uniref:Uncharacterized protein n=1 Tax=Ascoidea rubescens DSM 1968 TaxID=1344418 RepID=A0A1D2VEM9_9ASCO|nr:hypothetical protein ASCRUDRAFT_76589 [Ascoidea rubescens DSM 1968]ODV60075.1 hypothetical protein ASCRUDRAFT_76589 [Ascoidea rubescens DSM 1968]
MNLKASNMSTGFLTATASEIYSAPQLGKDSKVLFLVVQVTGFRLWSSLDPTTKL